MANTLVNGLLGDFTGSSTEIVSIVYDQENNVEVTLFFPVFDFNVANNFEKVFSAKFPSLSLKTQYTFANDTFCVEAVPFCIELLRSKGVPLNGFFHDAKYSFENGCVTIQLNAKTVVALENLGFEEKFIQCVRSLFHQNISLNLLEPEKSCTVPVSDTPLEMTGFSDKKVNKGPKKEKLAENDLKNSVIAIEGDTYEPLMGRKPPLSNLILIHDAVQKGGKVVICGDILETENKELRNKSIVRTALLTDYSDSVMIKVYDEDARYKVLESLKAGDTIITEGEIHYDERERSNVFVPRNIIKVSRKKKTDNAETKRIELHQHTNMSQMDAIPSAEQVVMRAASLGHRAVAITDHGSVQAFPEARSALKKALSIVPDFKILYGCEVYYVDDSAKIVTDGFNYPVDGDVVCFDLETTGLDCEFDRIIEIGACIFRDGQVCEVFNTFVDPETAIPSNITELTGITNEMVTGAPKEKEALQNFFDFCKGLPLVAHNASFDMSFVKSACTRLHLKNDGKDFDYLDTLALSQSLLSDLARHKLDTLTKYFKLPTFNHHRASDDAIALARIYGKLCDLLKERDILSFENLNEMMGGKNIRHAKTYHMIILVKEKAGLKNLYTLVSDSNIKYFHGKPRVPLSDLLQHREGLIIGSACEAGEIYRAILEHRSEEDLLQIAQKYDYFEIQPRGNNEFLLRNGTLKSEEDILEINRKIVALADRLGKPCVATCDVHFLDEKDAIYRQILQHGIGFTDSDSQAMLTYKTTDEMLEEFSYLGKEKAYEVVVKNPNDIADSIDGTIQPIPDGSYNPSIPGSEEQITERANNRLYELYGDDIDPFITKRAKRELDSICGNGYAVLYLIAQKLVDKSESDGYHVGSRGSVGSSFVAFLLGISEVNPLPVHYRCPKCKHFEFSDAAKDGFDLPAKNCPVCGSQMEGDGHDIPFETFLGFHGEKVPDIDLNFSSEYQSRIFKYTEELFGSEYVFKAGTIMALQDKNAMGYVRKYAEDTGTDFSKAEMRRLALGCTGVKKSTGQHPGGMVVIPSNYNINDFTPVQRPADKTESDFVTTHFDFNSLHDTLLKLDELGHEIPTVYHYLEYFSGMKISEVPNSDEQVFRLFTSPEPLGVTADQIGSETGTFGIPEMGTVGSRRLLMEAQPKGIADLIQISGLSHGTGVWTGNAQDLIRDGTCTISDVIGTRDGIMLTLKSYGLSDDSAFKIMEFVRKNKHNKPIPEEMISDMREHNVPEWYIDSCRKIQYMFPKAHAAAYITSAVKVAWFKLYRPLDFYAAYFTVRGCGTDVEYILGSVKDVQKRLKEVEKILADFSQRTAKTEDEQVSLQMILEMKSRGFEFLPVNLQKSHWKRFEKEDGKLRVPFTVLKGVGENAAKSLVAAIEKGSYLTAEDLLSEPGVSQSLLDLLDSYGALGDIPKTRQISFF